MTLIGNRHLPLLAEGTATVATAGTPVQVTAIKGKKLEIQALAANDAKLIAIGLAATVDGLSTPPVGRKVLYATQSDVFEEKDVSTIYIDSDVAGAKVHYAVYG